MSDAPIHGLFEAIEQVSLPRLGVHGRNSYMVRCIFSWLWKAITMFSSIPQTRSCGKKKCRQEWWLIQRFSMCLGFGVFLMVAFTQENKIFKNPKTPGNDKSNFFPCAVTSSVMKIAFKFQILCSFLFWMTFLFHMCKECVLGCYDNTFFQSGKRTLPFISCVEYSDHTMMGTSALFGEDTYGTFFFFFFLRYAYF